jgi:predicted GNAT family N-acyltransferase
MVQVIAFDYEEKYFADIAFQIRRKVFVDEQGVSRNDENDFFEISARHYLAFCNQQAAGAARWRETNQGIKLERFAVLKEFRNKGIGALLLKKIIRDTKSYNKQIYLHAQLSAVNFYEREGFKLEGELFSEADIQHYKMVLRE